MIYVGVDCWMCVIFSQNLTCSYFLLRYKIMIALGGLGPNWRPYWRLCEGGLRLHWQHCFWNGSSISFYRLFLVQSNLFEPFQFDKAFQTFHLIKLFFLDRSPKYDKFLYCAKKEPDNSNFFLRFNPMQRFNNEAYWPIQ